MSRLIKASIDMSKIKKEHIFKGEKGQYINVDIWVNDEPDKFGNICSIAQSFKVGNEFDKVYIGNGKDVVAKSTTTEVSHQAVPVTPAQTESDGQLPF